MSEPQNYGKYIDQIRKARKLSRGDLVDGIMSVRNYQRFISGETSISNENIFKIYDKLSLNSYYARGYINAVTNSIDNKFRKAYGYLMQYKINEIRNILYTIDKEALESPYYISSYNYLDALCGYHLDKNTTELTIDKIKQSINYPKVLEYEVINMVELNALITLNTFFADRNDTKILNFLYTKMIKHESIIGIENEKKLVLFSTIAKGYYEIGEYQTCIDIANLGINKSKSEYITLGFRNLYAYKAFSLYKLGRSNAEVIDSLLKVIYFLNIIDDNNLYELYRDVIKKTTKIDINNLLEIKRGS